MIQGIQGRGDAHASVGIAHAHQGLALGHRRRAAEPAGRDVAAQPAAIVTLSQQGRALAQKAIEAERAQGLAHQTTGAKRLPATLQAASATSLSSGAGVAAEAAGAIAIRRAVPRGIAKKLVASLSATAAAPTTPLIPATTSPATRTARLPIAEAETATAASTRHAHRGPAWGQLIRQGGFETGGKEAAAEPTTRVDRAETKQAMGRGTLHDTEPRQSARALMQAAAARLVAEARTRRDDQRSELAAGPARESAEPAQAPHERAHATAERHAPQAAKAAVAAAAEQAGLALPVPERSAS
jgi:hypothetical protein